MKKFKEYINEEVSKEEELGEVSTDTASIFITGSEGKLTDDSQPGIEDIISVSTGSDGDYKVIARWNDFNPDDISHNIPTEIVIKIREDKKVNESFNNLHLSDLVEISNNSRLTSEILLILKDKLSPEEIIKFKKWLSIIKR